jgi:hypothetical protein
LKLHTQVLFLLFGLFRGKSYVLILTKMGWISFWPAFSRAHQVTDVMILKIFSQKYRRKHWRFLLKTKLNYGKI